MPFDVCSEASTDSTLKRKEQCEETSQLVQPILGLQLCGVGANSEDLDSSQLCGLGHHLCRLGCQLCGLYY